MRTCRVSGTQAHAKWKAECWRQLETVAQKSKERWASNILKSLVTILRMQWWIDEVIQVSDGDWEDGYGSNHGGGWHLRDAVKKAEKGRRTQWEGAQTGVMELQRNGWIWHMMIDTFDYWSRGMRPGENEGCNWWQLNHILKPSGKEAENIWSFNICWTLAMCYTTSQHWDCNSEQQHR